MNIEEIKEKTYDKWSKLGLLEGLDNLKMLNNEQKNFVNRTTTLTLEELEEYWKNQPIQTSSWDPSMPLLPVAMRIASKTIAMGGWQQSKKQKQKQDRLNKLRQLQGEEPNIVLSDDEFVDGIVSVQPMSTPNISLIYMDYKYQTQEEKEKQRRVDKIKYILKNNTKKWTTSRFLKKKL